MNGRMQLGLALALTGALAIGCGDKDKDSGAAASGDEQSAGTAEPAEPAKPAGAPEMSAPDFFAHYSGLEGMEVLDAYRDGVIVSGTVLRTIEEMDESLALWLDASDGKWVSLNFTDDGAAAREQGLAKDASAKAECKVGGATDNYVMLIDCELK
jgi:hypothetical protein